MNIYVIGTGQSLIDLQNNANNGETYLGVVIYLNSDLDFPSPHRNLNKFDLTRHTIPMELFMDKYMLSKALI